jgi:hypothetical protein
MAEVVANLVQIQRDIKSNLEDLMNEVDHNADTVLYPNNREHVKALLQRRWLNNNIRVLQQLDKVIEVSKQFLAFVRLVLDGQARNVNLLSLFAPDSVVIKLVDETALLLRRLSQFHECDTQARQFLSYVRNNEA